MLNKYLHFTTGLLFVLVASTAFLVITQFSKGDIINILEICASQAGVEAMPADLLKTAKIIRHQIWDLHIAGGLILVIVFFTFFIKSRTIILLKSKKIKAFYNNMAILLTSLLISGLLHLQTFSDFLLKYKQFFTDIHFGLSFIIVGLVIAHVVDQIKNVKSATWNEQ